MKILILSLILFSTKIIFGQETERYIVKLKDFKEGISVLSTTDEKQTIRVQDKLSTDGSIVTVFKENGNDMISLLKKNDNVIYFEKDYIANVCGESLPKDPQYYKQWAMKNNGDIPFTVSKKGSDINMEQAWEIEQGDSNVIVAIIDSGIKWDHPDFAGRIWINKGEVPNNEIDDDGNGFVDDFQGWDFADDDNNPKDENGHGTNIASIIGANSNNFGFTGMDWNCKLMNLKVLNASHAYYSWWIEAIYYAVDNGADVINMSLGGSTESQALNDAINYALSKNVVVVVGMGNNNTSEISYPSNLPGVMAVGSTDPDDTRSQVFHWSPNSGSNFGNHISVVAPGSYIFGLNHEDNLDFNSYYSGTSQSTAYVSGLASLLRAQLPNSSNIEIKELIESTSDDQIGDQQDTPGKDIYYGHGRINAYNALSVNNQNNFQLKEEDLLVYPNPTNGEINLCFPKQVERVQIINAIGIIIQEFDTNSFNKLQIKIDLKGYSTISFIYKSQIVIKKILIT